MAPLKGARSTSLRHRAEIERTAAAVSSSALARTLPGILALVLSLAAFSSRAQAPSSFADRIAALSEPGGYFDTDNLISNERSYLQVLPALRTSGAQGGAYIGVGPDQNFSYMAAVRPEIALIIDIRRDNLLLHLLFKALFELAETRSAYLALLLGRPDPRPAPDPRLASIGQIVDALDRTTATPQSLERARRGVDAAIRRTGMALSAEDFETIDRFHRRFITHGLDLRFNSLGRPPQSSYPTYRDLLLETDAAGHQAGYLAAEAAFQFVKSLQERDLVIPVVGDLAGPTALAAIGRMLAANRQSVSALYVSNVEFYLYAQGRVARFVLNLEQLPRVPQSVVIRSVFDRYRAHARTRDGSTSRMQSLTDMLRGHAEGRYRSYGQLAAEASP